jgi:osmoprotectant transport system permease protein
VSALVLLALVGTAGGPLTVGSKKFTESVVLGEVCTQLLQAQGLPARHRRELGGTRVVWGALLAGDLDLYVEYTGTLREEILAGRDLEAEGGLERVLQGLGVRMSAPLGFDNSYALGMRPGRADELGVAAISDLTRWPELAFGFGNEFMDRGDGWPALRARYGLPQTDVRGLDHDLAYRALAQGDVDVVDLYATDAEIAFYGLRVLRDDLDHFPAYQAVQLWRSDLEARAPGAQSALRRLEGRIDDERMRALNARARIERVDESRVAAGFLADELGLSVVVGERGLLARLARRTLEHLVLVGVSLALAILLGLPLGVLAALRPRLGQALLGIVGVLQTVPSLALLVLLIPLLGIGALPAIVACFLYSLLPIVRNTCTGLTDIPASLTDSAIALGLPRAARLVRVELPLASRSILAGIKTSAVIDIGLATLGALIGAGGYGQPILTGIRLADTGLLLEGALPAAALAVGAQLAFELGERVLVPRGLRLGSGALG